MRRDRYHHPSMTLTVNGETRQYDQVRTVADLLRQMGLANRAVAVEVNRDVVPRRAHADTPLREGDVIELVTLVGGG